MYVSKSAHLLIQLPWELRLIFSAGSDSSLNTMSTRSVEERLMGEEHIESGKIEAQLHRNLLGHNAMRKTLPRSSHSLTMHPERRTCHSHINPKLEGSPIRRDKQSIRGPPACAPHPPTPRGMDRPCAQQGHTQRPSWPTAAPPAHKPASEGYTEEEEEKAPRTRGPQANHDMIDTSMGQKQLGGRMGVHGGTKGAVSCVQCIHAHRQIHSRQAPGSAAKGGRTHGHRHTDTREQTCSASEHLAQSRRHRGAFDSTQTRGEVGIESFAGLACAAPTLLPTCQICTSSLYSLARRIEEWSRYLSAWSRGLAGPAVSGRQYTVGEIASSLPMQQSRKDRDGGD